MPEPLSLRVRRRLHQAARAVWLPPLVALVFWGLFIEWVAAVRWHGDVRPLLCVGEWQQPPALARIGRIGPYGYDGQYYAALAADPLLRDPATVTAIDAPAYRATRILVPASAWLLALGQPERAVLFYQLLCWAGALAAIWLTARWLRDDGHAPAWALLLVWSVGLMASVVRSTPDAAALALTLAALFCYRNGRFAGALAFACAAVLTRETVWLAAAGMAFVELRQRRVVRAAALAALPAALVLGWQWILIHVLHLPSANVAAEALALPLRWLPEKIVAIAHSEGRIASVESLGLVAVLAALVALALLVVRLREWDATEAAFALFAALAAVLSFAVMVEIWAYGRAVIALPFLAAVIAERQPPGARRRTLRAVVLLSTLAGAALTLSDVGHVLAGRPFGDVLRASLRARWRQMTSPAPRRADELGQPLVLLPIARTAGKAGADWQTVLELENLADRPNQVRVELFTRPGSTLGRPTPVVLAPRQRVRVENVGEALDFSGAGALRLTPASGGIRAAGRTYNAARGLPPGALLPALGPEWAFTSAQKARMTGLAHEPDASAGVRSNVGVLNLGGEVAWFNLELFGDAGDKLGELSQAVLPQEYFQVDNVFAKLGAGPVYNGRAELSTRTAGATFFVFASVIRGSDAEAEYVFPHPPQAPD
jgi:hypothetical protein